ncbi:sugar ABC transporter ATP-binding protein [Qaidamihabitans albus]|uniref:sugar ABC transporter ATP-binding protein n=1 Tax=Qaidamihabitans albus TaxID=2795733 RepID=UPI0018F11E54|nr:sugar ABC transporter ATP-binding protein [Qaidamihabitans albus]
MDLAHPDHAVSAPGHASVPGVEVLGVSKKFGGQYALRDVDVSFARGRVTALLGHNGSGKSTLIKILSGYHQAEDGGRILINGDPLDAPVHATAVHERGLRFVHQDLALLLGMSIADNFALEGGYNTRGLLGRVDDATQRSRASTVLNHLGLQLDPRTGVGTLDGTEQTMVAIARALQDQVLGLRTSLTLVLDEPTATLPHSQVHRVFAVLDTARRLGATIIYVTHRLDEVTQLADDVVVLRDGAVAEAGSLAKRDVATLARAVTGMSGTDAAPLVAAVPPPSTRPLRLEVRGLCGDVVEDVSLSMRRGEICGVAGFMGSGIGELARILGGDRRGRSGTITLDGEVVTGKHPWDFLRRGICYISADRRRESCVTGMSLRENLTLGDLRPFWRRGRLQRRVEQRAATSLIDRFEILPRQPEQLMSRFSGGNQQKAVLAKNIRLSPALLVVEEPAQGVDVGARRQIHAGLRALAASGTTVVVASTDLEELLELADRVVVLDRGRVTADVASAATSLQQLTRFCNGEEHS